MKEILDAFAGDADEELLNELRQLRSDPGTGFDDALARLSRRLLHDPRSEAMNHDDKCEWQEASGLMAGGDPGGVTPDLLREHQGMSSDVINAACLFMEGRVDDNASFMELKEKLAVYLKRWPEQ